ncbi:chromosome partition protein Smc [Haloferula helveola]
MTFDDHVLPIFEQACLNCHNPDKTKGGLDLSNYAGALKGSSGGKVVESGNTASTLIAVVRQTAEPKMPPEGDPISGEAIKVLENWIAGGLLQNSSSKAKKPEKPKFDTALQADPTARPDGPPPMPKDVILEPAVVASRSSAVHAMVASPWAPLLAITGQKQILLYDTDALELAGVLPFPEGDPVSLAFTPNGRYLIAGGGIPGKSGVTVSFDVITGERALTAAKEFDTVLCTDLRPDLGSVATGSPSKLIKLWKTEDGSRTASIKKHTDWVTSLDFSPDGILLATGDRNGGVWVWEAETGNEFHTLRAHQAGISAARFRSDSNVLATASADGTVRFWEMNNGNEVRKLDAHPGGVLDFAWAPDGSFVTAGRDRTAKVWKPDFGQKKVIDKLPDIPTSVAINQDGKRIFVADYTGRIHVYDIESGNRVGELDHNPPTIAARLQQLSEAEKAQPAAIAEAEKNRAAAAEALNQAKQKVAAKEAAIREARKTIETSKRDEQEAANKQKQTAQQLEQQRSKLADQEKALAGLREQIQGRRKRCAELDPKIASADGERKAAENRLTEAKNAPEGPEKAAAVTAAETASRQKTETLNQLKQQRQSEAQPIAGLEKQIQDKSTVIAGIRQEIEKLNASQKSHQTAQEQARQRHQSAAQQLPQLEKQLPEVKKALEAPTKSLQEADQRVTEARQHAEWVQRKKHHWQRAALNAESIAVGKEAARLHAESETLSAEFAETTRSVEELRAEFATKRGELEALRKDAESPGDSETAAERASVVTTLQATVEALKETLANTAAQMNEQRSKLDALLPQIDALRRKSEELKRQYVAAAPKAP